MKKVEESVANGIIFKTVAAAIRPPLVRIPKRIPLVFIIQHMGTTNKVNMMVPQFAIMATVLDPQPGYAAFILSLRGPHKFH